tara:strand:- start:418 stop:1011 length:594 start_codon:yes stop_codon:yes gene_type:complete
MAEGSMEKGASKLNEKVFNFVKEVQEDLNFLQETDEKPTIAERTQDKMVEEKMEMTEEPDEFMDLTTEIETIDPFDKDAVMKLQKQIMMSEEDIDGIYGPKTDRYLKTYLVDMNETFSDAARFNLGLGEFSGSPAAEAYNEHLEVLKKMDESVDFPETQAGTSYLDTAPEASPSPNMMMADDRDNDGDKVRINAGDF